MLPKIEAFMKLKLDTKTIAGLELAKGRREDFAWDTEIEGFGLRLRRSGEDTRRTYVAQYRIGGRRSRRVTLGAAAKLTPTQAREAARKILARVSLGHDPQGEKQAKREAAAQTFKAVTERYLAAKEREFRPSSYRSAKLYLAGAYFKPLHTMPISEVRRSNIAGCVRNIVRNHSAATAGAARRAVSAFFAWSIVEGLLGDGANPVDGAARPANPEARDRVLSDDQLAAVWRACGDDDDFSRIVRLLILLGSRRQEIGGMRWSEIDLGAGTWTLPAERSKNHRGHTITLPAVALDIIQSMPRTDRDHLFGNRSDAGFNAWDYGKTALDRRLGGAVQAWRLHDIRRSVATGMIDLGIEPHHVEAVLNHHGGHRAGVAAVYNRSSYEPQIKAALAKWAAHVAILVKG
jgi:integrase